MKVDLKSYLDRLMIDIAYSPKLYTILFSSISLISATIGFVIGRISHKESSYAKE